ncbi:hypothetical protein ZWY2020_040293 [Hordeum vulgare]|nr:hypothetical protein ZWY2020_040293 [Hordeum vulgare]
MQPRCGPMPAVRYDARTNENPAYHCVTLRARARAPLYVTPELTAATRPVLHHRRRLRLRYNTLSGALPSDLASLATLRSVFLNGNRLSANFSAPLLAQPGLLHLSLGGNGLSGAIPPALANLTRLKTLLLEENRFAGEIPDLPLPPLRSSHSHLARSRRLRSPVPLASPPGAHAPLTPLAHRFAKAALPAASHFRRPPMPSARLAFTLSRRRLLCRAAAARPPPPTDSLHRRLLLAQPQRPAAPSPSSSDGPPSTRKELDMVPTGGCYYRIANLMPRVEIGILQPVQKGLLRQGAYLTRPDPVSAQEMITSPWCIPFIYVVVASYSWSLMEPLQCGDTVVEWWNAQRMWLKRRTTSYLLAAIDTIGGMLGISESGFELTVKVDESQAMERYKKGKMEFGPISGMFVIITTISLFNLACLVLGLGRVLLREGAAGLGPLFLQAVLCVAIVVINAPVYEALFIRRDSGSLPYFVTLVSLCFVSSLCLQAT